MQSNLLQFYIDKVKILRLIVFVILLIFISVQVISLTRFLWFYNYYFDYGKMLKSFCKDAYTEYETPRFHLYNNSTLIRINGDAYNDNNIYATMILITIIIVVLYVALIFWYMFLYCCIDGFKDIGDISGFIQLKNTISRWEVFYVIMSIYIIIVILLYIPLKLTNTADISPFEVPNENVAAKFTLNIFIFLVIVIIFIYKVLQQQENRKNILVILMPLIYALFCYILTTVCDIYLKTKYSPNPDESGFKEQYKDDPSDDLLETFFANIFRINEGFKTWNSIIILLFIALGFVGFIAIILMGCIYMKWIDADNQKLLYYCGWLPLITLFIIVFIGVIHIEYNTYINKYLLFNPELLYKQILSKINNIFNQLLINDKSNISEKSVCFNIANAIHLSIYSDLFKNITNLNKDDEKQKKYIDNIDSDLKALLRPAFKFTKDCDSYIVTDYNEIQPYNIDYYINDNTNMFYTNNKDCSGIRNGLLYLVMINCIRNNNDNRKDKFEKWLRYTIDNVYNKKQTYSGKENVDFESVEIRTDVNTLNKTSENKFDKHLDSVINDIVNKYDEHLWSMHLEVIKTVKALCKCTGLPDITLNDDNLKNDLPNHIFTETDGTYTKNIKKDFINVFVMKTRDFLTMVNKTMSSQILLNEHNYRLNKLIIKTYNKTQGASDNGSNKFLSFILNEEHLGTVVKKEDTFFNNPFKHIEEIEKNTSNIVFFRGGDDKKQEVKTGLKDFKNEYELVYKKSALHEALYKYKVEYIETNITDNFDKSKYVENNKKYNDKFKNLTDIANDKFKNELIDDINKLPDDIEENGKSLSNAANTSAELTYFLFVIYILSIAFTIGAVR